MQPWVDRMIKASVKVISNFGQAGVNSDNTLIVFVSEYMEVCAESVESRNLDI